MVSTSSTSGPALDQLPAGWWSRPASRWLVVSTSFPLAGGLDKLDQRAALDQLPAG
ncbi:MULTISPECIES: hypothetical protein [Gordonia]|uniref:hypothetical protein n=1 Tax=Gordonia TaxID=2053 RepID=UPI00136489CD|nr:MULTISPECIES: hypothetical protein [Gordonia]MCM3894995.1 hypothetical protein [Gordonia sputi]